MTTIDQSTSTQIAQPDQQKEKLLWLFDKPTWWGKREDDDIATGGHETQDTFYRKAIEWSHRADKVINLVLGYLLAVASVLGFMDVLSGGEVLGNVPYLFYVWLGVMGLGVEFQIFLVIGRMPDLARTVENKFFRFIFFLFNIGFLAFLCYMSVVIAAVFTQHRDVAGSTIGAAMSALGIDPTRFVFERAALATLLLVLMAIDRTMERWRMQIDQRAAASQEVASPIEAPGAQIIPEEDKFATMLQAFKDMQSQTVQALQAQHEKDLKITAEQITRVTVEIIESKFAALPEAFMMPLIAQESENAEDATDMQPDMHTDEIEAVSASGKTISPSSFGEAIAALVAQNPDMKHKDIAQQVGCSVRTVALWKQRMHVQS